MKTEFSLHRSQWRTSPLPGAAYWCDSSNSDRDTCWDSPQEDRGLFYSTGVPGSEHHDPWSAGWFCYDCLKKIFLCNNGREASDAELDKMMQYSLRERLSYEASN